MKRFALILILVFFAFLVPSQERAFAEGGIAWDPQGVPICEASQPQWNMRMVSDGSDGAIVVWEDYRDGEADIYVQKIDEYGNRLWAENGVLVCTNTAHQGYPVVVGDGYGGAFIAWEDHRVASDPAIYAVRISSNGATAWPGEVKLRDATTYKQSSPEIVSNELGGAVVVWEETDGSTSYKICANWIDENGTPQWGGLEQIVSMGIVDKLSPKIINDGQDHVIITS